jgi:hypothetical protein
MNAFAILLEPQNYLLQFQNAEHNEIKRNILESQTNAIRIDESAIIFTSVPSFGAGTRSSYEPGYSIWAGRSRVRIAARERPLLHNVQAISRQWVPGFFPEGKAAGALRWPHTSI